MDKDVACYGGAASWFRQLKALVALIRRAAWQLCELKESCTACTAASTPDIWPAHNWREPTFWMSVPRTVSTGLAPFRLATSPIPIGRTPGFCPKQLNGRTKREPDFMDQQMKCTGVLPSGQVNDRDQLKKMSKAVSILLHQSLMDQQSHLYVVQLLLWLRHQLRYTEAFPQMVILRTGLRSRSQASLH